MNTLTLITEGHALNHHYEAESIAWARTCPADYEPSMAKNYAGRLFVVMKEDDVDDFLQDFIDGKSGYKVQVETDRFLILVKGKCFATCKVCVEEEGKVAFIIETDRIVS